MPGRSLQEDIVRTVTHARGSGTARKEAVLLTAPHGSEVHNPIDDPCTADLAFLLEREIRRGGHPCSCFVSRVARVRGDQNRIFTAFRVWDIVPRLLHLFEERGSFDDLLHVDVHSFTSTDDDLPPGWGRGINILHLKGDEQQRRLAMRFKRSLDACVPHLPAASVIEHGGLPTLRNEEDSNAMIEISRYLGAGSLLAEFPTHLEGGRYVLDGGNKHTLVRCVAQAIGLELSKRKRGTKLRSEDQTRGSERRWRGPSVRERRSTWTTSSDGS